MNTRIGLETIDARFNQTLQAIQAFLRQPSISRTGEGVNRTVQLVVTKLRELDFDAVIHPTPTNPLILATRMAAGDTAPTLLIHVSIDVMTTDGEAWWSVPPFAAAIRDHPRFRPILIGRGVYTQKANLIAILQTLHAISDAKEKLPLNLILVVDSEEESSSPGLPAFDSVISVVVVRAEGNTADHAC